MSSILSLWKKHPGFRLARYELNCTAIYCDGFAATGSCQRMRLHSPTRQGDCRCS